MPWRRMGGVFLTSALVWCKKSTSRPAALPPGKEHAVPIGKKVGYTPRAGLADIEKWKFLTLSGLELRPLGRPARSQSPYRLHYPISGTMKGRLDNDKMQRKRNQLWLIRQERDRETMDPLPPLARIHWANSPAEIGNTSWASVLDMTTKTLKNVIFRNSLNFNVRFLCYHGS
jgi:hypothetical protein